MSDQPMPEGRARPQRVFLVDGHALMRQVVAGWIDRCASLEVCGMAGSVGLALRAIRNIQPDIVVTEIMRPDDLGFIRELHHQNPCMPILVFTIQEEALYKQRAKEAGAGGYLMKLAGGEALIQQIRARLRGRGRADSRKRAESQGRDAKPSLDSKPFKRGLARSPKKAARP